MLEIFYQLMIGHAIADYALQPPNIALGKNRHSGPPAGYDERLHGKRQPIWILVMTAHALIHAGMVLIITGDPVLSVWQLLTHFLIDVLKCERMFNLWVDQFLHTSVLAVTAVVAVSGGF